MSVGVQETTAWKKVENTAVVSTTNTSINKLDEEKDRERPVVNKRVNKAHFSRTGSFRNKLKIKQQQEVEVMSKGNIKSDSRFWRIRHFGHYDIQSVTVDRLGHQLNQSEPKQVSRKHTGASAAHMNRDEREGKQKSNKAGNELVAPCPAFTNEVGEDWLPKDSPITKLRDILSQEKKMRIYSRERAVMDGHFMQDDKVTSSQVFTVQTGVTFPLEYIDYGACYYRDYFYEKEHQNFVGFEEGVGPIVISLRREKVPNDVMHHFSHGQPTNERGSPKYQYRVILRTSELPTLRGTVLEETIPTSAKSSSNRAIPPKEVIEYVTQGELQTSSLKVAKYEEKLTKELMRLDEQELNNRYKIGVLYCKAGQTCEEEWYNNESGSKAFDEFLGLLGDQVKMKGFTKYKAQLDNKSDTTGEHSVFTEYENSEMMFHVSTLLPYTENNKQQLLRKRHIGNDIVTLIFQEPGSEPFSPKSIRSHFQHIFIVVRVENPNTPFTEYKVAVSRSCDVPYFGPPIPESGTFQKSEKFRNFLLTKLVNACNAALQSEKLYSMAARTRKQYLSDLCKESGTSISLDQVGGGALGRLFGRKRERFGLVAPLLFTPGALTWSVSVIMRHYRPLPFSEEYDSSFECTLCLAPDIVALVDSDNKIALLHIPTQDISGYSVDKNRINLFYDNCFCLSLECHESDEDLQEFCKRLMAISPAQEAILLEFSRSVISGLLGFTIDQDGAVVKVDGLAKMRGLQKGARVLQVEDKLVCCRAHQEIVDLLHDKHRVIVKAYVIPPVQHSERPAINKVSINWEKVWATRPQVPTEFNCDISETNEQSNIPEPNNDNYLLSESEQSKLLRKSYMEAINNGATTNQKNRHRPDHLQVIDPYQDDENIYDRLITYDRSPARTVPPTSPSVKSNISSGPQSPVSLISGRNYSRMKVHSQPKAIRQSVINLANSLMDQRSDDGYSEDRFSWTPVPAHHHIDDHSPHINTLVSQSTYIPDRSHTASPLSSLRKPPTPGALGERNAENMPHHGQVHELTKRFSQNQRRISSRSRNSSRNNFLVPIVVHQDQLPKLSSTQTTGDHSPKRNHQHVKRRVNRPQSWDLTHVLDDIPVVDNQRGESLPPPSIEEQPPNDSFFTRSSPMRQPFRNKESLSPTPPPELEEDSEKQKEIPPEVVPIPPFLSQLSGEESLEDATKLLDDVLEEYMGEKTSQEEEKINKLSVRVRTQLWELKTYTQTLPRSFKTRTSSQPGSPMRTPKGSPGTPFGKKYSDSHFNYPLPLKREEGDGATYPSKNREDLTESLPGKFSSDTDPSSYRTLPLPRRSRKKGENNSVTSSQTLTDSEQNKEQNKSSSSVKNDWIVKLPRMSDSQLRSPVSKSEKFFKFEDDQEVCVPKPDQLTWDSVMGDISNYCRSVAEWVKQTEDAGVLDTPPPPPDSPTCSDAFSFTSVSFQSENVDVLREKVEKLEDKLDKESENNLELRSHLKKMEKQINDLQKRQTVRTKV